MCFSGMILPASIELQSLRYGFTNYTPFYNYWLLIATKFHGIFEPLLLIKANSFVFEFGCAILAFQLVKLSTGSSSLQPTIAYAAVWLAPSVFYNGPLWGQADSLWTFFILLSVYLICRKRDLVCTIAFAVALSIKAQAIFLAPFIFAFVLGGEFAGHG